MTTETRELKIDEFYLAEKLWEQYRDQKADPLHERIFGVFVDGALAATARYTKHPDGVEMDCVFVPETSPREGICPVCCGRADPAVRFRIDLHSFNHRPDLVLQDIRVLANPRKPASPKYKGTVLVLFWRDDGL